jgi:hypothetical protein
MTEQLIHDRPVGMPGRRVDHHSGGLVNRDDVLVLVEHREGERLGCYCLWDSVGQFQLDDVIRAQAQAGSRPLSVELHGARFDERLQARARQRRITQLLQHPQIESSLGSVF